MTALLILAGVAAVFWLICRLTDRPAPHTETYPQPTHVRVLDDQEPAA